MNSRKIKSLIVLTFTLFTGGLLSLTSATTAQAAQNFHGNICQPTEGKYWDTFRYTNRGVEAKAIGTLACPLHTDGTDIISIEVNVAKTNLPTTACWVYGVDWDGFLKLNTLPLTIPQGNNYAIVYIPAPGKGAHVSYTVMCNIPVGQILTSLNVQ